MASSSAGGNARLDLVTERFQQCGRAAHRRRAFGMKSRMKHRGAIHEADPQAARRLPDCVSERARRRRRHPRVARHVARHRVQRSRGVAHGAHERALFAEPAPELRMRGSERGPAARAFEADQSAEGGGNPDRSAGVAAVRNRHDARRDRCGRAAARSAGDARRVPRIAGRAPRARLGRERRAPLRDGGLRERDQACRAELRRHVRGRVRDEPGVFERLPSPAERLARNRLQEVLHQERHPAEHPGLDSASVARLRERLFVTREDDAVELRVQSFDPRDRGLGQFGRRDRSLGHEFGLRRRIQPGQFAATHRTVPLSMPQAAHSFHKVGEPATRERPAEKTECRPPRSRSRARSGVRARSSGRNEGRLLRHRG